MLQKASTNIYCVGSVTLGDAPSFYVLSCTVLYGGVVVVLMFFAYPLADVVDDLMNA